MTNTYIIVLIILSVNILAVPKKGYAVDKKEYYQIIRRTIKNSEQNKYSRINRLVDIFEIKPRMTVLDIGCGAGYYLYKIADKLKGTGKVFATDVDMNPINFVTREARERGFTNIYPVLVSADGVDEFYSKHRYDLIIVSHVYIHIKDPVKYFKEMRKYLTENGRLVLINYKYRNFKFLAEDFKDLDELVKKLSEEDEDSPYFRELQESTKQLIRARSNNKPDKILKDAIINDFNELLRSPALCVSFLDGHFFKNEMSFTHEEKDFTDWLLLLLYIKERRLIQQADWTKRETGEFSAKELRAIKKLNKLLLIQKFRPYLYKDGMVPYISLGNKIAFINNLNNSLEKAGYELKHEEDLLPFELVLVFSVTSPQ